jgi:hypothetical protein
MKPTAVVSVKGRINGGNVPESVCACALVRERVLLGRWLEKRSRMSYDYNTLTNSGIFLTAHQISWILMNPTNLVIKELLCLLTNFNLCTPSVQNNAIEIFDSNLITTFIVRYIQFLVSTANCIKQFLPMWTLYRNWLQARRPRVRCSVRSRDFQFIHHFPAAL